MATHKKYVYNLWILCFLVIHKLCTVASLQNYIKSFWLLNFLHYNDGNIVTMYSHK